VNKYAFFRGQIVPVEQAKVSVMTHALNYGTACFGGLRGYWNSDEEQLYVFRILDHYERFLNSARLLRMAFPYSNEDLVEITLDLLHREGWRQDVYIRPLAYKADERIGVRLHGLSDELTIFSLPFGRYIEKEEGAHVTFSSWRRVDDNAIPARGKISGSYVNSALIKTDAVLNGFDEALVLNPDGHLAEGSAENVFIIRKGVAITPPITDNILEGITRRTILHLLRSEMGVEVMERPIDRTEVYLADEAFFCGTGVQIAAIAQVDHRPIGEGRMGLITAELRDLYFDIVRGRVAKYRHWCTPVYSEPSVLASAPVRRVLATKTPSHNE
jgi:branched-chain amino acid aminotransferase